MTPLQQLFRWLWPKPARDPFFVAYLLTFVAPDGNAKEMARRLNCDPDKISKLALCKRPARGGSRIPAGHRANRRLHRMRFTRACPASARGYCEGGAVQWGIPPASVPSWPPGIGCRSRPNRTVLQEVLAMDESRRRHIAAGCGEAAPLACWLSARLAKSEWVAGRCPSWRS